MKAITTAIRIEYVFDVEEAHHRHSVIGYVKNLIPTALRDKQVISDGSLSIEPMN
ncbi:hypothetical protein QP164_19540 [Sphingomonas sp. LR59]|uniref:hypothetical protein n=1 Tax=Sphingomonas sp. LR59 TaxID=3050232 RepID=UPI002FE0B708